MKIGLIGGTGGIGNGMACRWSTKHEVFVGSRNMEKSRKACDEYRKKLENVGLRGCTLVNYTNRMAAEKADVVVVCVPFAHMSATLKEVGESLEHKVVISPVVPMERVNGKMVYVAPDEGSAALLMRRLLPESASLAAAFHSVPANKLADLESVHTYDVVVCGEERAKRVAYELSDDTGMLRALDGGGLENAYLAESITPLLINLGAYNKLKNVGVSFISDQ